MRRACGALIINIKYSKNTINDMIDKYYINKITMIYKQSMIIIIIITMIIISKV